MGFLYYLLFTNCLLFFYGLTVIENADKERFPATKSHNIYDLGIYKNISKVFGNNPLVWLLPGFANYEGEGIVYETIFNMNPALNK